MAALNVSFTLKNPTKPSSSSISSSSSSSSSSLTNKQSLLNSSSHLSFTSHPLHIEEHQKLQQVVCCDTNKNGSSSILSILQKPIASASLLLFLSASLCFSHPSLAFKGGGPYGQGVTRGQDLSSKDFSGLTLIKQDFKTSILRMANFKGAKLLGASFFDADLTGADLSDADLRGADFSLANVTKVNLSNANLEGALVTGNTSFKGSNITGADFTDVPFREDQREYLCKVADGVNPTTGNATRETLLCN